MENNMLEEQKAVIVGGTSGIGLAAAIELCRAGAQVWMTGRTPDKATAAAAAIGDRATGHAVDARDAVKLQTFFARLGEFDHLVIALGAAARLARSRTSMRQRCEPASTTSFGPISTLSA